MIRKILRVIAILLAAAIVVVGGYAAYVFIAWHRLPDSDVLSDPNAESPGDRPAVRLGEPLEAVTWNLGFGAYSADFGFFLDGGTESRARSREAVLENINHAVSVVRAEDPDFALLQEIDIGSDRSWHVDEAALIEEALGGFSCFAQNYDSPYLFYPLSNPHGASKSGLLTLSDIWISRRVRRGLPVETGLMKLLDLDRCYSKSHFEIEDSDRQLVIYNLHLSAYTSDGAIATEQFKLLCADMQEECAQGNYCLAGGDFNKDLLGNSGEVFGVSGEAFTWAQPLDTALIPEGLSLVNALDASNPVPSCRNADGPYAPGESFVLILDGFIVSDNVSVSECHVIDEGFACSDHNPVKLSFSLKPEPTEEA